MIGVRLMDKLPKSSCRGPVSIPCTHIGQLTTNCNKHQGNQRPLASKGTCTPVQTYTYTYN